MGNFSHLSGDLTGIADELRAKLNNALRVVESMPSRGVCVRHGLTRLT
jgi:hypothetical protein